MTRSLAPLIALATRTESLSDQLVRSIAHRPLPGAATKVGLILASCLANDLRASFILSQLGYGLQAMSAAANVLETAGALSYVGRSETRALAWARHTDKKHTYPQYVQQGIDATLTALGISDPAARTQWYDDYRVLCMAKHTNPHLSMWQGMLMDDEGAQYVQGPDATPTGVFLAAEALYYSLIFGTAGAISAASLCREGEDQNQVRAEAVDINNEIDSLQTWYLDLAKSAHAHPPA